ncbi:helix-turn-helix domain protein [Oscillochloris trichoides DG-6]|uniref:Helix-turn-helix domain protein n=1 Tax=Oscillochloris trichoides DG-6 TaxID=765420 RepID=E1IIM0_9CHLR|nr:XRE family transcriptional regulator [Oscillochloris trichoides]EFO78970.1 helix-turn-helix domain protein [Oscillochloris trichoides DG-6]
MLSQQLRHLRLARGLSLEALAQQMGGLVTKQALSKYEQGKAHPSPLVLNRIAAALGVKVADLVQASDLNVSFIAYRRRSDLGKRQQEQVQSLVREAIWQRLRLQRLIGFVDTEQLPIQSFRIESLEDAEQAAETMRERWQLGSAPIANVTAVLEDHTVQVVMLDADEAFDGIAAVAHDAEARIHAATVVTRRGVPGERQRLNLCHELGHLVLAPSEGVDEEKAAFRFGAAFLAPAQAVVDHIGTRRAFIQPQELLLLKRYFGMSTQALLYRLRTLGIITESYYRSWCIDINRMGWKRHEPEALPPEEPTWLCRTVLRAASEELMTTGEAQCILGTTPVSKPAASLINRRALMQLPLEERRRLMAEQAAAMADDDGNAQDSERELWQGGDIIEQ